MATYIADIIESNGGRNSQQGWEFTRIFIVDGLAGSGYAMIVEAKAYLATQSIDIGSEHPEVSIANGYTPAYIFEMEFEAISGNQVKATAIYRQFDTNYKYSISANSQQREIYKAYDNASDSTVSEMIVEYTYPLEYGGNPAFVFDKDGKPRGKVPQAKTTEMMMVAPQLTISRVERYSISADAQAGYGVGVLLSTAGYGGQVFIDRNKNFANRTNGANWNIRAGDDADIWLCNGITASSQDNGLSWDVTYTFTADYEKKWKYWGIYENPETNETPPDIIEGVGFKEFRLYRQNQFSLLELS